MTINWQFPQPRSGLNGALDKFIGPGATPAEIWLELMPALLAAVAAPAWAIFSGQGWSTLQLIIAGVIAFDMVGGIATNATSTAKRWYHRPGQTFRDHIGFTALHVLHLAVVAWLFRGGDWVFALGASAFLLIAAAIILLVPLYLQRPTAFLLYALSLLLALYVFSPTPGLEWFLPFFYLQLLVSHLVREEPYRPASERPGE